MPYGNGPYGTIVYAGEGADEPPIPPIPPAPSTSTYKSAKFGHFGCGTWTAQVVGRGGSPLRYELSHTSIGISKPLNNSGQCKVDIPAFGGSGTNCCEAFENCEPWRDEILVWRDNDIAFVGPLVNMKAGESSGEFIANDLFFWTFQRFLEEDFHGDGDVADVFHAIFDLGMSKDPSPNISVSTRATGISATRDFKGKEFQRCGDKLQELARTGLDFTMDGRNLLAGGLEVWLDTTPIIIHDDGVLSAEVSREGGNFATDVGVFGATLKQGGQPVTGRATRASDRYGLIQRSFTELDIRDGISADANAEARLLSMQPIPWRLNVTLGPEAAFDFTDVKPGRRVDVRLKESVCISVMEEMRLIDAKIDVRESDSGMSELVSLSCIPLGVTEDAG